MAMLVCGGLGCGGGDGDGRAWEPTEGMSSSGAGGQTDDPDDSMADDPSAADTTAGAACEPGSMEPCLCPDGLSLGQQRCDGDGSGFEACECEGETDDDTGDPMPPLPAEVCYLGADRSGTTCLPLVAFYADLPEGYAYPPGVGVDGQDRPPLGLVDIQGADPSLLLAPNFALDELAQLQVGRYAVLQPHAVASLQAMRDQVGGIAVLTGYLSPSANAAAGGETYARHQYGDGFVLSPNAATLGELSSACVQQGGTVVELGTSLRCEWSTVPLDEAFFGPPP